MGFAAGQGAVLGAERQRLGAQAGRGVSDRQADQIGFAAVGKLGLDLGRGVDLLPRLVQGQQRFVGFQLGEQREFFATGDLDLFGLEGDHIAIRAELTAWPVAFDVLAIDPRTVGVGAVLRRHVFDPAAFDVTAISGRAFDGDPGPLGAKFFSGAAGHGKSSERWRHLPL